MLTDEDLQKIAALLEAYGLTKQPSKAALRTRKYRERKEASQNVTGVSQTITEQGRKRHKTSQAVTKRHTAVEAPTKQTWNAYATAFQDRYQTAPKWNGMTGGLLAHFVSRLGAEEAPKVAAFYVMHNGRYYVQQMHSVKALVSDAEKLRTEWATNRTMTETEARQSDRTQTNANIWGKLIAEADEDESNQKAH